MERMRTGGREYRYPPPTTYSGESITLDSTTVVKCIKNLKEAISSKDKFYYISPDEIIKAWSVHGVKVFGDQSINNNEQTMKEQNLTLHTLTFQKTIVSEVRYEVLASTKEEAQQKIADNSCYIESPKEKIVSLETKLI